MTVQCVLDDWGHESGQAGVETHLQTKIVWAQM